MDKQTQKIAEFINGITDATLPPEQQVTLFQCKENEEGGLGEQENGTCTNKSTACTGSKNNYCTNYDLNCGNTTNRLQCDHKLTLPNFDTHSCGG